MRTLSDLESKGGRLFSLIEGDFLFKILEIARENSPEATYNLTLENAKNVGFNERDEKVAEEIARAARFLAIIKRDYGLLEFDKVVAKLIRKNSQL